MALLDRARNAVTILAAAASVLGARFSSALEEAKAIHAPEVAESVASHLASLPKSPAPSLDESLQSALSVATSDANSPARIAADALRKQRLETFPTGDVAAADDKGTSFFRENVDQARYQREKARAQLSSTQQQNRANLAEVLADMQSSNAVR